MAVDYPSNPSNGDTYIYNDSVYTFKESGNSGMWVLSPPVLPSGTAMVFYMETPPLGWTQNPYVDDTLLKFVNADGGIITGESFASQAWDHSHNTTSLVLTAAQIPPHVHGFLNYTDDEVQQGSGEYGINRGPSWQQYTDDGSATNPGIVDPLAGQSHNHGPTYPAGFNPKFTQCIVAVKD